MTNNATGFLQRMLDSVLVAHACRVFIKTAEKNPICKLIRYADARQDPIRPMNFSVNNPIRYNPSVDDKLIALQAVILKRASIIGVTKMDHHRSWLEGVAFVSAVIDGGYVLSFMDGKITDLRKKKEDEEIVLFTKPTRFRQNMTLMGMSEDYLQMVEAIGTHISSPTIHLEKVSITAVKSQLHLLWQETDSDLNWDSTLKTVDAAFVRWAAALPNENKFGYFSGGMLHEYMNQLLRMKYSHAS